MPRILVETAHRKKRQKHGGGRQRLDMDALDPPSLSAEDELDRDREITRSGNSGKNVMDKESRKLMPVAIQCQQKPGTDNPIFIPDAGWRPIAKTIVGIADGNYHEAITQLPISGRCTVVLGRYTISGLPTT